MSPSLERLRIPDSARLERRPTCQPTDERPALHTRDPDGTDRVLAVVESWRPSFAVN